LALLHDVYTVCPLGNELRLCINTLVNVFVRAAWYNHGLAGLGTANSTANLGPV
jgi:hypothetical protein